MKKLIRGFGKILLGIGRGIVILTFLFWLMRAGMEGFPEPDRSTVFWISALLFVGISLLHQKTLRSKKIAEFGRARYVSVCFILLESSFLVLMHWSLSYPNPYEPGLWSDQQGMLLIANMLFWGIAGLWWQKIQRTKVDQEIVRIYEELPDATPARPDIVVKFVKSSELLNHRTTTFLAGESFNEKLPSLIRWKNGPVHAGTHYYRSSKRATGQNFNIDSLEAHAFWYFPMDLPDQLIRDRGKISDIHNASERAQQLITLFEQGNFKSMEIRDHQCLLIKGFPPYPKIWGFRPIPAEEIAHINQQIAQMIKSLVESSIIVST